MDGAPALPAWMAEEEELRLLATLRRNAMVGRGWVMCVLRPLRADLRGAGDPCAALRSERYDRER